MLKRIEEFAVTGLSIRTSNKDEFNQETAKLPHLWKQFYSEIIDCQSIYGVYANYDSDSNGFYSVTAGTKAGADFSNQHLSTVKVEAGDYLVFEGRGAMPETVIETWQRVWNYFTNNTDYKRKFVTDFEHYQGQDHVAVYIGIESYST